MVMHFQPGWWNTSLSSLEEEEEKGSVWCPSMALWQWKMMMDVKNKGHFTTVCPYSPWREEFPGVPWLCEILLEPECVVLSRLGCHFY